MLKELIEATSARLDEMLSGHTFSLRPREIGIVTDVGGGIAQLRGLPHLTSEELVEFRGGQLGIAVNLEPDSIGVVLLGDSAGLSAGSEVRATGRFADTPVGKGVIGRVIDATGRVLDGGRPLDVGDRRPVERPAPAIMDRAPVTRPLLTGLKVVDALIPIGRGQRELIVDIHLRLLERSAQLGDARGGGSLTALPIVETQAQDISAYIPTNLISITDGQIYLSPELYRKGLLPAIDVGTSVSRVGGKTQLPAYRAVAGDLRLAYSQFEELETFARFATRLDEDTRVSIERGRRVRAVLTQAEHQTISAAEQIATLHAVNNGSSIPCR